MVPIAFTFINPPEFRWIAFATFLAIFTLKGEAIALAKSLHSTESILEMDHGSVATLQRVLMPRGTYPRVWRSGTSK